MSRVFRVFLFPRIFARRIFDCDLLICPPKMTSGRGPAPVHSAAPRCWSDFCLILHSWMVTMSQKHSPIQTPQLVQWALMTDTVDSGGHCVHTERQWLWSGRYLFSI